MKALVVYRLKNNFDKKDRYPDILNTHIMDIHENINNIISPVLRFKKLIIERDPSVIFKYQNTEQHFYLLVALDASKYEDTKLEHVRSFINLVGEYIHDITLKLNGYVDELNDLNYCDYYFGIAPYDIEKIIDSVLDIQDRMDIKNLLNIYADKDAKKKEAESVRAESMKDIFPESKPTITNSGMETTVESMSAMGAFGIEKIETKVERNIEMFKIEPTDSVNSFDEEYETPKESMNDIFSEEPKYDVTPMQESYAKEKAEKKAKREKKFDINKLSEKVELHPDAIKTVEELEALQTEASKPIELPEVEEISKDDNITLEDLTANGTVSYRKVEEDNHSIEEKYPIVDQEILDAEELANNGYEGQEITDCENNDCLDTDCPGYCDAKESESTVVTEGDAYLVTGPVMMGIITIQNLSGVNYLIKNMLSIQFNSDKEIYDELMSGKYKLSEELKDAIANTDLYHYLKTGEVKALNMIQKRKR